MESAKFRGSELGRERNYVVWMQIGFLAIQFCTSWCIAFTRFSEWWSVCVMAISNDVEVEFLL